jgi:hypothetical protein
VSLPHEDRDRCAESLARSQRNHRIHTRSPARRNRVREQRDDPSTPNAIAKLTASNGPTNSTLDRKRAIPAASIAPITPPMATSSIPSPSTMPTS